LQQGSSLGRRCLIRRRDEQPETHGLADAEHRDREPHRDVVVPIVSSRMPPISGASAIPTVCVNPTMPYARPRCAGSAISAIAVWCDGSKITSAVVSATIAIAMPMPPARTRSWRSAMASSSDDHGSAVAIPIRRISRSAGSWSVSTPMPLIM
jgi:hypothetical protein